MKAIIDENTLARLRRLENKSMGPHWRLRDDRNMIVSDCEVPEECELNVFGLEHETRDNMRFVAEMRNAAPLLLDSVDRLRKALAFAMHEMATGRPATLDAMLYVKKMIDG